MDKDNVIPFPKSPAGPTAIEACTEEAPKVAACADSLEINLANSPLPTRYPGNNAMEFVEEYLAHHAVDVLFDGSLVFEGVPLRAENPAMIDEFLQTDFIEISDLADMMFLHCRENAYVYGKSDLTSALRQVGRRKKKARHATVVRPLLRELSVAERGVAERQWAQLGEHAFEMSAELSVAILQTFIWQVKQKALGRAVEHHLMPVIVSPIQGSGKTTMVRKFLAPLQELATGAALLSDFVDKRNLDIFRFPAVLIDDLERIDIKYVSVLKALLTADGIRRRKLGSSMTVGVRQAATPIGTANTTIQQLITDDTGHRRFAEIPYRNGQVAKGGDEKVWEVVSSIDYGLLWASVDAFAQTPILPQLENLFRHQGNVPPSVSLRDWLRSLDLKSERLLRITERQGVRAEGLRTLFNVEVGVYLSQKKFSNEMDRYFHDRECPFEDKLKIGSGMVYRVKRQLLASSRESLSNDFQP